MLGGHHGIEHGSSNSVILPYAVAYNERAAPEAMEIIKKTMGTTSASGGIYDFARKIGVPKSLMELGMCEGDLDRAAQEILKKTFNNPKKLVEKSVRELLQQAFEGKRPVPF